ncbi:unnamed protein product [Porites evermanni]|uniref:Tafazzin family protein n=1 Tax=Porites evermanni TaxID=104178 RepID=A0ABN8QT23_9CNID|nr:unnamed protein product [Porites evermanni]
MEPMEWPLKSSALGKVSWRFQSAFILGLVGLSSKIFLEWFNSVRKYNYDILEKNAEERPDGVPLVTVCNHTSCLDDPCLWEYGITEHNHYGNFLVKEVTKQKKGQVVKMYSMGFVQHGMYCSADGITFAAYRAPLINCKHDRLMKIRTVLNTHKKVRWTLGAHELLFATPFRCAFFSRAKAIPVVRGDGVHQKGMEVALERLNQGEWIHIFPEGAINMNDAIKRLKWGKLILVYALT